MATPRILTQNSITHYCSFFTALPPLFLAFAFALPAALFAAGFWGAFFAAVALGAPILQAQHISMNLRASHALRGSMLPAPCAKAGTGQRTWGSGFFEALSSRSAIAFSSLSCWFQ